MSQVNLAHENEGHSELMTALGGTVNKLFES